MCRIPGALTIGIMGDAKRAFFVEQETNTVAGADEGENRRQHLRRTIALHRISLSPVTN
jgi:hypothetical protein